MVKITSTYKRSNSLVGHHSLLLFNSNGMSRLSHMGNILEDLSLGNIHLMQRYPTVCVDTMYPPHSRPFRSSGYFTYIEM